MGVEGSQHGDQPAASVRGHGVEAPWSDRPIIASGSNASTTVVCSSRDLTTTLQGSTVAIDGSIWSASWASGGRHAPRMTWGATSTSSLALSVARRSISVRTPNPWSARPSRTSVTAASYGICRVVDRV